jgi:hypothetical protein
VGEGEGSLEGHTGIQIKRESTLHQNYRERERTPIGRGGAANEKHSVIHNKENKGPHYSNLS